MAPVQPLACESLCWRCAPDRLDFTTTAELDDLERIVGQQRAIEALGFALDMRRPGYNVFALGPSGINMDALVRQTLERRAAGEPVPDDWAYVNNFEDARKPQALRLPHGRGQAFAGAMARLVEDVGDALRAAFGDEEYAGHRQAIEDEIKERQEQALAAVQKEAESRGLALLRAQMGFAFAPVRDGKVISQEDFQALSADERERIENEIKEMQRRLQEVLRQAPQWAQEARERLRKLNEDTAAFALGHLIDALKERFADLPAVVMHLDAVRADVVENVDAFLAPQQPQQQDGPPRPQRQPVGRRYEVNLIVGGDARRHAPVVYEDEPTFERIVGRIEQRVELGALLTDFSMIRAGALHAANGGYLMLDARKVLTRPLAWDGLKRALRAGQIRTEPLAQAAGVLNTVTLEPEPIPLDVKVVLLGERLLYYLLADADPEFGQLFKVAADFDERVERDASAEHSYARLIASLARRHGLKPITNAGVARLLEYCARQAGDAERLTTRTEDLLDLMREADYWATRAGGVTTDADHVNRAIQAAERRLDRVRERVQEEMRRDTIVVATDGAAVGQINGLSVSQIGGFAFGRPARISARVGLGRGEVIDIEREVALSGPLHSKGVLILTGFLRGRYAPEHPLSLSASLVFEQSYGGVDGDSASSTELYALLSAVSGVPINQALAVTGSVDQYGNVQAIGGVNEKIEGFFDLCAARGLSGEQGVLIPKANVKHLMLRQRVCDAARAGRFHVYPIQTIDQGIEVLTGVPAGKRGADGHYPDGTVNALVEARLVELAEARRAYGLPARAGDER